MFGKKSNSKKKGFAVLKKNGMGVATGTSCGPVKKIASSSGLAPSRTTTAFQFEMYASSS
tara:strand:- start:769 stop:948 length:180 start_codon:yes stop_codon:yes gene_type:complete